MSPDQRLGNLLGGFAGTQLLYVVAELGVADALAGGAQSIEALAEGTNAVPHVLYRYLRALATHGVFSGSALERIEASPLKEVIVTDTIPLPEGVESERITSLSVAPLFGEAIRRIHRGESVGALFSSEVELVEEMTFWGARDEDEEEAEAIPVER